MSCLPSRWRRAGELEYNPATPAPLAVLLHLNPPSIEQALTVENMRSVSEKGILVFPLLLIYFQF